MTQEEEIDSWVRLYRRTYGDRASQEAQKAASERRLSGDKDGARKWQRISEALG